MSMHEPLPQLEPGVARLVLHPKAMADLIVSQPDPDDSISICGLFLKRYNDEIPLYFLPGARLTPDALSPAAKSRNGDLWLAAGYAKRAAMSVVSATTSVASAELHLPILGDAFTENYFNINWSRRGVGHSVLLSLRDATPYLRASTDGNGNEDEIVPFSDPGTDRSLPLMVNASYSMTIACGGYVFTLVLRCVSCDPARTNVEVSNYDGALSVSLGSSCNRAEFCAFVHPLPGLRLLSGRRTLGFHPGDLVAVLFPPFPPRVLHYLSCPLSSANDVPLSYLPVAEPRLSTLNLLIGTREGMLISGKPQAAQMIERCETIAILGEPPSHFIDDVMAEEGWFSTICLVSGNRDLLMSVASASSAEVTDLDLNSPVWVRSKTKTLGIMLTPYGEGFLNSLPALERMLIDAVSLRTKQSLPAEIVEARDHSIRYRLPALPYCVDLAVGIVALVGNMLRGRLPVDRGQATPDYTVYSEDSLWLVPWGAPGNISRSRLLFELNARIAAEYLAVRSFLDLSIGHEDGPCQDVPGEELADSCVRWYERWEHGEPQDQSALELRHELRNHIKLTPTNGETVMRYLAQAAYDACTGTGARSSWDPYREGLSYVNPLVLVFAAGGADAYDMALELDTPYWALYAGRCASLNASSVVASFFHRSQLGDITEILRELRLQMYSEHINGDVLFQKRTELGQRVLALMDEATFMVLDHLAPSRIVAFSDVPLDFLEYGGSILGMEIPMVRYPASSAYVHVSNAVLASDHTSAHDGKKFCAILCAPEARDNVTTWAIDTAARVEASFQALFGGDVSFPVRDHEDLNHVLDEAEACHIVVFLGHAQASEHWAGLDVGAVRVPRDAIGTRNWTHSMVFLIGCETSAADTTEGDIAEAFLRGGARAVVGSLTKISVNVAAVFFAECFEWLQQGLPVDYAFYVAREKAVIYEALCSLREDATVALKEVEAIFADMMHDTSMMRRSMRDILERADLDWADVMRCSPTALSLTILGGAGERLV